MRKRPKVLIDNNIWNYLASADAGPEFVRLSRLSCVQIVIAPGTMREGLETGDAEVRDRLIRLQTHRAWIRPMPEAYLEAREVRLEMGRLHPEWLIPVPDRRRYNKLKADWRGGRSATARNGARKLNTWQRAMVATSAEAAIARFPAMEQAQAAAEAARMLRLTQDEQRRPLADVLIERPFDGWVGPPVEAWRVAALADIHRALFVDDDNAYRDWLSPFLISPFPAQSSAWPVFWLVEASQDALPRHWTRWAIEYVQRFQPRSNGKPGDSQLSSHLVDADFIISADKRFVTAVNEVRLQARTPLAFGVLVPGGGDAVDRLFELLTRPAENWRTQTELARDEVSVRPV